MKTIDGRAIAAELGEDVKAGVDRLRAAGVETTLAVVVPTADESTAWYVRSLERTAQRLGIRFLVQPLSEPSPEELSAVLTALSSRPDVHGVVCQTPLPEGVTPEHVGPYIAYEKDVDGANPLSAGRLAAGLSAFAPATAAAVLTILKHEGVPLTGATAVVVGRSTVVGKPAAVLLTAQDATVTLAHSRTKNLAAVCRSADVLVVATGKPRLVGTDHVRDGAVVIDVGTNPTPDGGLVGDVAADTLQDRDVLLTPVPGGVGPVTSMVLMDQTRRAAVRLAG